MDTYSVEFRIEGTSLIPSEVTKILGLVPSQTSNLEFYKAQSHRRNPFWAYDGISSESNFIEKKWESLEEGLLFTLDKLLPKSDVIHSKFSMHSKYFWCAHFQESFNGGPSFSPKLLKKLSDFNVELIVKNYHSSEE